jgi:hypothetical protein
MWEFDLDTKYWYWLGGGNYIDFYTPITYNTTVPYRRSSAGYTATNDGIWLMDGYGPNYPLQQEAGVFTTPLQLSTIFTYSL